jgi:hypothetical protein
VSQVVVEGWVVGFEKIKFTHLLMDRQRWGLADAKGATDKILQNEPVVLTFTSDIAADAFARSAEMLGARVKFIKSDDS